MTRILEIFPNLCSGRPSALDLPVLLLMFLPVVLAADSGWWHTLPDYHSRMWFRGNQSSDLLPRGMLVFRRNFRGRLFSRTRRRIRRGMFRHDGTAVATTQSSQTSSRRAQVISRQPAGLRWEQSGRLKKNRRQKQHTFRDGRRPGCFSRTAAVRSRIRRATETERSR